MSKQRYFLDREARTLNAEIVVDTGPPALLGEIVVEGNKDVSTTYIRERAPWKAGTEPWNESRVQDYVDELRGLGLFSMVRQRNIKDVPSPRKDGMVVLPVQLVVREGPPRSVSAGARYETDSGIGVEGEWETPQLLRQRGKAGGLPAHHARKTGPEGVVRKTGLPGS